MRDSGKSQSSHPSSHRLLKEASDCTDTWRLKTLLSNTVIPSHKSVAGNPLCTDKASQRRLIYTWNGESERETFFFLS